MCVCVYVCSRVRSRTENGRKEEEEDGGLLPAKENCRGVEKTPHLTILEYSDDEQRYVLLLL